MGRFHQQFKVLDFRTLRAFFCAFLFLGAFSACRTVTPDPASLASSSSSSDSSSTPTPTASPSSTPGSVPSEVGAVYLRVDSSWETDDNYVTTLGKCIVPMGSSVGTSLTPSDPGCTITVPEGQLFYSKLHFIVGTTNPLPIGSSDATLCASIIFSPYYYLANTSNAYTPDWLAVPPTSPIDCSVTPTPSTCYNGPATAIVPGFPNLTAMIFHTIITEQSVFHLNSGHMAGQKVTRWAANDYAGTHGSLSGQDYIAECRNIYYDLLYSVRVKITPNYGTCYSYPSWSTGVTPVCP